MVEAVLDRIKQLRDAHREHADRLQRLAAQGVRFEGGYPPDGGTIQERIAREEEAVEALNQAIRRMEAASRSG